VRRMAAMNKRRPGWRRREEVEMFKM